MIGGSNPSPSVHFTSTGHFYSSRGEYYHSPRTDFCVSAISDGRIDLLICPKECGGGVGGVLCLPKCCAMDEALLFFARECYKINGDYWNPEVYEASSDKIRFYLPRFPEHCTAFIEEVNPNQNLTEIFQPHLRFNTSASATHPISNQTDDEDYIRLSVDKSGGIVRPAYLDFHIRKWILDRETDYCADAFILRSSSYASGHTPVTPGKYVTVYCSNDTNDDGEAEEALALSSEKVSRTWVYTGVSLLSLPFMLATVVIYVLLVDKLNLHGLAILSYSVAEFLSFFLLIIAQFVFLFPVPVWVGLYDRKGFCYFIAVSGHFFYFASFFWLSVMNFDLWTTFRSIRVIRRDAKEPKKFLAYSLFAWGLPLGLVGSFIAVDEAYRDPRTEVPVPDYGWTTCFVSEEFRGFYVHLPTGLILGFNLVLIVLTMKIFVDARRQRAFAPEMGSGGGAARNYS